MAAPLAKVSEATKKRSFDEVNADGETPDVQKNGKGTNGSDDATQAAVVQEAKKVKVD